MLEVMRAAAIIPARGGSKGIPGKNLQQVGEMSLVARTVVTCSQVESLEQVYVSTDSYDIGEEARKALASAPREAVFHTERAKR
jgi:N-acylneuraminate cytidylyltransferase